MYVLSFKNSIFLCVMCAHTIYVAAKHHFAHKKNKNHSLQRIFVIYLDWLERGQNLKKVGFFAAYQTGHSYINLMGSFEFRTLLKIFWVTLLKVKQKVTLSKLHFQRCSRVTFLIWSIYETSSQIFLCRLQFCFLQEWHFRIPAHASSTFLYR